MGLFDFFRRDKTPPAADEPRDKKLASLAKTASDKRAQAYDRDEAIRALIRWGTPEAAACLLKRFKLNVDPSITDQEEKQLAFDGVVAIGQGLKGKRVSDEGKDAKHISDEPLTEQEHEELRAAVTEKTKAYCRRAQNLTWALKVLRELLNDEPYQDALLSLLAEHDTEYTRNVEPKINLLAALEDVHSDAIRQAVEPYLDDVDETVRYHAVQTLYEQADNASMAEKASLPAFVAMLKKEESIRIKNKVAEGLLARQWRVDGPLLDDFREGMRDAYEYRVNDDGSLSKA